MSILATDKKTTYESISNYDTLKKVKISYENIDSILKYSNIRMDTETVNQLKNAIDILENLYRITYSTIEKDPNEYIDLYLNEKCPDCNSNLYVSDLIDYSYLCKKCDENFYAFEVPDMAWYLKNENKHVLNSKKIQKVDKMIINEYISCWVDGKPLPIDKSMIYTYDGNIFIAINNTSNECYVEEFGTEEEVLNWFNEFENEYDMEIQ